MTTADYDPMRVRFVRWLADSGRINEGMAVAA